MTVKLESVEPPQRCPDCTDNYWHYQLDRTGLVWYQNCGTCKGTCYVKVKVD